MSRRAIYDFDPPPANFPARYGDFEGVSCVPVPVPSDPVSNPGRKARIERACVAKAAIDAGIPPAVVGRVLGLAATTIGDIVAGRQKFRETKSRPRPGSSPATRSVEIRDAAILAAVESGLSVRSLESVFGLGRATIDRIARRERDRRA